VGSENSCGFVSFAEKPPRPLAIGWPRQAACGSELRIDVRAQLPEIFMRLNQVLTVGIFAFVQVRDSIETKPIHTHGQPEVAHLLHGIMHGRIIKIQIRLMRIKPMPIVRFCQGSHAQFDVSKSLKMIRASLNFSGVSLQT
jgi:hypothetical protein